MLGHKATGSRNNNDLVTKQNNHQDQADSKHFNTLNALDQKDTLPVHKKTFQIDIEASNVQPESRRSMIINQSVPPQPSSDKTDREHSFSNGSPFKEQLE